MLKWICVFGLCLAVSQSLVTIDKAQLFQNTLKRWNIAFEHMDRSDKTERYQRFVECYENVNRYTKDIILQSLNAFCVMNNREFEPVAHMFRGYNLTKVFQDADFGDVATLKPSRHKREVPKTFDYWEKEVGLYPPSDQLGCGSCWSFPTAGTYEPLYKILTGDPVEFSQQYFVNCNGLGDGCAGGDTKDGYKLVEQNQFIFSKEDYPYKGYYTECPADKTDMISKNEKNSFSKAYMARFNKITSNSDSYMENLSISPIAFGTYVSSDLYSYSGGVFEDKSCKSTSFGHAMLIVGYTEKTWRVKASWGTNWGDNGYVNYDRFADNIAECNFFNAGYVVKLIERRDVEYEWCKQGKVGTYSECKNSCTDLDDAAAKRTGWTLAIVPTKMHNERLLAKITEKYGTFDKNVDDKYNYFWFGARDPDQDGVLEWIDGSDFVYSSNTKDLGKKFGLFAKKDGSWSFKSSTTFSARGFCSRYVNCFDISMKIPHAAVTYSKTTLEEGTEAKIECQHGTTLDGSGTLTCNGGGKWSEDLPECTGRFTNCKYDGQATLDKVPVAVNATVNYVCGAVQGTALCNEIGLFVPNIPKICKNDTTAKTCPNKYSDMDIYPARPSFTNGTVLKVRCRAEDGDLSEPFQALCKEGVVVPDLADKCEDILSRGYHREYCSAATLLLFLWNLCG